MFNNKEDNKEELLLPLKERSFLLSLPTYKDERGYLNVLEIQNKIFPIQRIFWLHHISQNSERGCHAHRTCKELFIAVSGRIDIEVSNGIEMLSYHLESPTEGLLIPEYIWCRLHNCSDDFVGLCLASQPYIPEGYINDYQEFKQEVRKKLRI